MARNQTTKTYLSTLALLMYAKIYPRALADLAAEINKAGDDFSKIILGEIDHSETFAERFPVMNEINQALENFTLKDCPDYSPGYSAFLLRRFFSDSDNQV